MKQSYVVVLFLLALVGLSAYALVSGQIKSNAGNSQKIQITTSFYPLYYVATQVGGDLVEVKNITPAGSEPHDYSPTPRDISAIYDSKLFIYNGNGLDPWADRVRAELESKGVVVIKMSENFMSLKDNIEEGNDPHFWLDPVSMQKEVDLVVDALSKIDKAHASDFARNRDILKQKLSDLDQDFRRGLASCQRHEIVTSHNAFGYLGNRYGFASYYILGLSPDEEPSPKRIAEVADIARQKNIGYIFFETLVDPKLSQTIANEVKAKVLVLNPIEGLSDDEISANKNYITVMKQNLANLKIALVCQ